MKALRLSLKKPVSLLLCIMLILTPCACTSSSGVASSSRESGNASQENTYTGSAPISDEKVTISILTTNSGSKILGFEDMAWWQEVLKNANVELDIELVDSSSYQDIVKPRLAAATDLPDIVLLSGKDSDMSYINSGIFIELTDYYDKYAYNLNKQFEKHLSLKAELTTPDEKIFYVPYIYTTSNNARTLMMNMGYLDAVGMEAGDIKTTDDFYAYLTAVKNSDANGNGDATDEVPLFCRAGMVMLWSMYWGLDLADSGGYQVEDDDKVICGYADDRYLEYLTYMNKLYSEGLLYSEFSTANLDTQSALYANNQVGSLIHFISNCTSYSQGINPDWDFNNDDPIMQPIVPLTGPNGDQYAYGRDALGTFFGITNTCKDPDTVFKFIDYLYSEEVGILTWYGIESTDYNIVNGNYVATDVYLNNEDGYTGKCGYNFCGLPSYQLDGGYMVTQCQTVRDISSNVISKYIMNPTVTFSFKLPEESEVLQAYSADLSTYFSENLGAFIMGTRPLSEWNDYLAELEAMHLQDVIAVYQASADRAKKVQ